MFSFRQRLDNKSFTLIELLIVIAILALLMSIIIITLNPSEMLKKSRDTKRISSLKALNNALGIFQATKPTTNMGTSSIVYVSIPDSSSTCTNLSLPTLPSGYTYQCSTTANYRKTDGTGWIPVNFDSLDIGSPISSLPIDPNNTTSTGLYLTYVTGGSWEITATMEASDNKVINGIADTDGGEAVSREVYEVGTDLSLTPISVQERLYSIPGAGLYLWFMADRGVATSTGSIVSRWEDWSGQNNDAIGGAIPAVLSTAGGEISLYNSTSSTPVMTLSSTINLSTFSYFSVSKPAVNSDCSIFQSTSAELTRYSYGAGGLPSFILRDYDYMIYYTVPSLSYFVHSIVRNGTNVEMFENSVSKTTSSNEGLKASTLLGRYVYLSEVIVYNTTLTAAERQAVENYLNTKWTIY